MLSRQIFSLNFALTLCFFLFSANDSTAACQVSEPTGHYPSSSYLQGYVQWDGTNGTSVTFWHISGGMGRSNYKGNSIDGSIPGFRHSCCGLAIGQSFYRDNWGNAAVTSCPAVLDSNQGCGSTSGSVTSLIFETLYNATNSSHYTQYIAASADWDTGTASFNLSCRGNLVQLNTPVPTLVSISGLNVTMRVPNTLINIATGSPSLIGIGYQVYRSSLITPGSALPNNSGPWTTFGGITPPGGTVTAAVPASGRFVFVLKPVFTNQKTTTNVGASSALVIVP